jgi:hypothetical protein
MLLYHLDDVFTCFGAFWVLFLAIGFTAYQVNSRRPAKDPKKRNFHPFAVLLVPFAFLFFAPLAIVLFFLTAILYAGFILLFAILLLALRKPFILNWWMRFSTFVGEPLLRIGTYLIMLPFRLINPRPVQRPAAYGNL